MKTIFFMLPRQSGKTTIALDVYQRKQTTATTLFVSANKGCSDNVRKKIHGTPAHFISSTMLMNSMHSKHWDNIILDDYMHFRNKVEVYEMIKSNPPSFLYIFSTSDRAYLYRAFHFIKMYKGTLSYHDVITTFMDAEPFWNSTEQLIFLNEGMGLQFDNLYRNFITDPNTTIVDDLPYPPLSADRIEELRNVLSDSQFKVEILNQYLI